MLGIWNISFSQSYKKTFKALEEGNYTSARIGFQQAQQSVSTKALGDYGMAVVYRNTSLRIEDMYKACASINSAKANWTSYDEKLKKKYLSYVNENKIAAEKQTIDKKLYSMMKAQKEAKSVQVFIDKCPNSSFLKEATTLRDKLAFEKALGFNTIPAFKNFIADYPKALQINLAKENLYKLAWEKATYDNTVESYQEFINYYPSSLQIEEAKEKIIELEYEQALGVNTQDAFDSFINKYPNSKQAAMLKQKGEENAFNNVLKFEEIGICTKFLSMYPVSNHTKKVVQMRDSIAFQESKKLNTNKAYEEFVFKYPNATQVPLALSLMSESLYSRAELKRMIAKNDIKTKEIKSVSVVRTEADDSSKHIIENKKSYDIFGNCIYEIDYLSDTKNISHKYIYDDAGDKLLKKMSFVNDQIQEIAEHTYDLKGLNTFISYKCEFNCMDSNSTFSDSLFYDEKRNLISKIRFDENDSILHANYYKYDIKGNLIQDSILSLKNDSLENSIVEFNYNGQGNIIQKLKKNSKGVRVSVDSYSYDGLGNLITSSTYNASGTIYRTYFYNSKGLIESEYMNYEEYKNSGVLRKYVYE